MTDRSTLLTDTFGRRHDYLRISLTERCNMRCFYCMPEEGIALRPREEFMRQEELLAIAGTFVSMGVRKIRLTGGEPLVRNDAAEIIEGLSKLPIELAITTNGVLVDRFIDVFERYGVRNVNVSLDTLRPERMQRITRRDHYKEVIGNIRLLMDRGFDVKVNTVLIRGTNDDEIGDFVQWTADEGVRVRFIEFMPFDGNKWDWSKGVSLQEVLDTVGTRFGADNIERMIDGPHDTAKHYRIKGHQGSFAVISTVTNPFCDSCNRLRLTADGRMKNCLFSGTESDLLSAYRKGEDITELIRSNVLHKKKARGGMESLEEFSDPGNHTGNRAMQAIGG
ncbi:MAG: GTP 3',8-cyclase MoaA [Flavobacteriales bacterium]|jgi:cyclic pyranopterin phosphate synthase|nr:GTP 3',8-cyclase MoaA [Flavobacteriales bacterium]MBK7246985.1 GTP 3',8-cyclase MoaA [Flavobacteriales bacterium]MBK7287354.1 GTP 3',8-cyclase MoaA [Flavobacteriales bacterium]MBK9061577.1 GTP 3',8-cyclase MoaA [Flavobacteriales bacterium]MBK9599168.1 GTP 3',8-cyclase MoaA [Flavobacteriales bacterium]